ncbi:iron chelate uptake ABC transporter family permease subunit [Nocardioides sp. R-C-SC26]|uniref:FecCD family ABC transporter permease n=1 Tax=Nocardioides sp. R-C-SC26 TaxID=2870414 RepID=UPI001E2FEFE5|nr:iron chelate uptake ABC transporter family permease subunit [Nocardioides sp. R-C-SC26]
MSLLLDKPDAPLAQSVAHPRVRFGPVSFQVPVRAAVVSTLAAALLALLFCFDISRGEIDLPLNTVFSTLLGGGDSLSQFVVNELRLPQTGVAALVGIALGLSGALSQTFARNPLASPDILGISDGAAAAAVAVIVITGAGGWGAGSATGALLDVGVPMAALTGGLLAAALLYVLAWRRGIDGQRLVLIGIGLGAVLTALTQWLLVKARIQDAASAAVWLNGSLNARSWEHARPVIIALVVLVPVAFMLVHRLNVLQLGDDPARGLGLRLQTTQFLILLVVVVLAAVSVSAVGPLEFVAFVVPQVALRLTGGSRPPLLASMLLGGCLVVGADIIVRVVLPFTVPAGLVTAAIGAPYLIWLLVRTKRKVTA